MDWSQQKITVKLVPRHPTLAESAADRQVDTFQRRLMYRSPQVLLFDLGKVLLSFSHDLMCEQVGRRCGVSATQAREVLFATDVHWPYEKGEITTAQVVQRLESRFSVTLDPQQIVDDLGDIFRLNAGMMPILSGLKAAGWRTGILSNTCDAHWTVARRKFSFLEHFFDFFVTSFEAGEIKPFPGIYQSAAKIADCDARDILFVDDLLENVEAAREAGMDAVLYTSPQNYAADLRRRGVSFNY